MPRITDFILITTNETQTLSIRTRTTIAGLPPLIGASYGKLAGYLAENQAIVADIPFVAYHNMDMQNLDVEIGFPVTTALPGRGEIQPSTIPAGPQVFCLYQGSYREIGTTYEEMAAWIKQNGWEPVGTAFECYFNGPEWPEDQRLTKVMMPLKHK